MKPSVIPADNNDEDDAGVRSPQQSKGHKKQESFDKTSSLNNSNIQMEGRIDSSPKKNRKSNLFATGAHYEASKGEYPNQNSKARAAAGGGTAPKLRSQQTDVTLKRKTTTKLSTPGVARKSTVTAKTSSQLKARAERKSTMKNKANQGRNLSLHDYMAIHFQTAQKATTAEKKPDPAVRQSVKKVSAASFIQKQILES